ncbi:putative gibberellin regulated protein [Helianthus annuus]|uniref:snakin-2 n=1 Tax=Helianthus annuus TaxID=4232 RepID=UPI000B9082B3|nr:snakin-2 [Helianthus annuus]KAJ0700184.1 putative gibberellin regulated protein [Helianthus annuus]KAJ0883670.1 putative gibberellin regulated protein [Helianthus annuus]
MAILKTFVASLLVSLVLFQAFQLDAASVDTYPPTKIDCGKACATRCMLSKRPHLCNRACGTCCGRCNCVPPGTSGNYEACACYAEMTTRGNKKKCP